MKKVILLFLFFACILLASKVNAQSCAVSNPTVSNISTSGGAGGCTVTFDLSFDFAGNNGNKWKAIILWKESDYNSIPSNFYGANGMKVPTAADINSTNALATISINSTTSPSQTLTSYPGDVVNPTSFKGGLNYISTATSLTIKGITVTVPDCSSQINLKADVGASNANSFSQFGCLSKGELAFTANEPIIRATDLGCGASPRSVGVQFITTTQKNIMFKLFKDVAPFGQFTVADTALSNNVGGPTYVTTQFNGSTYVSIGQYPYTINNGERFDVWVVAYTENISNVVVALVTNTCAPLPVSFKSFTASRSNQTVSLKWETASEQNNRGFYVQRNVNGEWKDVAFVFSTAEGGNSDQILNYSYNDPNNYKGISYYRLLQVDLDGKGKYSEIRVVKGQTESGSKLMLFPNPGTNGKINVMFSEETSSKDVVVYDANGRVVKSYRNVVSSNLTIQQLPAGVYNVQVKNNATQIVSSEKFIIQN